jgi:hypothetical protein
VKEALAMKTNKIWMAMVVAAGVVIMGGVLCKVSAQCGWAYGEMNSATGGQLDVHGSLDDGSGAGTIVTKFWILGQATTQNSGTLPSTYQTSPWGTNSYYIWSNWGNSGVFGDCPARTDRSLFLYSIENTGNGQYILLNAPYNEGYMAWDFDAVTNGNGDLGPNTEKPVAIPQLSVVSQSSSSGVTTLGLSWPTIANLKGFYDVEPTTNLITAVAVRYYQGASAPTSFKSADWPVAGVVSFGTNGSDPGQTTVQVPDAPGMRTYVALSVLFDGGQPGGFTETTFVGAPTAVAPPAPVAPSFSNFSVAKNGRYYFASFSAAPETAVSSYVLEGARKAGGPFSALTQPILPGAGSYSVPLLQGGIRYYRVTAKLTDGSTVSSDVLQLSQNTSSAN